MIVLRDLLDKIYAINPSTKLVAVSKNVTSKEVLELYNQGQIDFGENRVQELAKKQSELSNLNIKWHMIGRLQSNKINQLISLRPALWQSCDSFKRAKEVDKRLDYKLDTLLQINSADEISKQGVGFDEAIDVYLRIKQECKNLNLVGVMSIGAHTDNVCDVQKSFEMTYKIFENLQNQGAIVCSMGMSQDYELALKTGSNMLRIGSILYV
ncbi:YggS family pyridoxal phosphate-dependent enzyme [Campylobacter mucosalis]|uniref:Pyridoxal phosphate homeostasis protein n=1 Tax=Campylobacter mucosalis CCUG 21559 TaxID=1032067 RepID=A0A6G5QHQ3_9BACT|nr:YggS family pyridoxal phosphate-dependent enzyme [Campylobacter mucosalis]QCD45200.1 type III pyridoxal 5-phosphate (PLP)-dependent enzyme, YggS family [Campylobacter mucosalis CCUG 21559]